MDKVYEANEDMMRLVNDLLNLTRAEEGRLQYTFEKIDFKELVEHTTDSLELTAKEKGLSLKKELPAKPIFVQADKDKLVQVVSNLIDNAIKYTEKGQITVSLAKQGNLAGLKIQDTGLGMAPGEMEHLFESFTRGKAGTKSWAKGAGLGLYIAKQFIAAHKGRIFAESQGEGKGSTFIVELPTA